MCTIYYITFRLVSLMANVAFFAAMSCFAFLSIFFFVQEVCCVSGKEEMFLRGMFFSLIEIHRYIQLTFSSSFTSPIFLNTSSTYIYILSVLFAPVQVLQGAIGRACFCFIFYLLFVGFYMSFYVYIPWKLFGCAVFFQLGYKFFSTISF